MAEGTEGKKCLPQLSNQHPADTLRDVARDQGCDVTDEAFARYMDSVDPQRKFREMFHYPKNGTLPGVDTNLVKADEDCVYMCGNSLGLQPKATGTYIQAELTKWANIGVHGHFLGDLPWALCDEVLQESHARLVGAKKEEIATMNGLTVNQHLLLISFYRPTPTRHKVLLESHSFPSDHYTIESQIRLHGYDPKASMLCLSPREGEETLRMEDILSVIEKEGESIAVVMFPGVQYYTGQLFDMPAITKAAKAKGCHVGFDLAHAIGNVEINLHDWDVDFACWCTYKYLNSGAGCIAGAFIHERLAHNDFPKLHGWWSHKWDTRFKMDNDLDLSPGPAGYRISNPPIMLCACLKASLDIFDMTSMKELRIKSKLLTGYLELLLKHYYPKPENADDAEARGKTTPYVEIVTPSNVDERGCHLSAMFSTSVTRVLKELELRGVVVDKREPNVLRIAPTPLYNSFEDVHRFVKLLGDSMRNSTKA